MNPILPQKAVEMKSGRGKIYAGFGFGPIQSALFLYEAYRTGNFSRFAVVDIDEPLIRAVRGNGGRYTVNIARPDRIDRATVEGVELFNATVAVEAQGFVEVVAASDELCTALPSVCAYTAGGETSVANLLARGLDARSGSAGEALPTIIYTAENNNRAAEILAEQVYQKVLPSIQKNVQFLNTVIGKMSGVIADAAMIERLDLATITPDFPRAILVEEFNRILISKIRLPGYRRGIEVFVEKEDLLPFEEAKLYGHNAIHALIAYLADLKGYKIMSEARHDSWIMETARAAFIEESGAALIRKHAPMGDPLFSEQGYTEYADDLLVRMTNPNLNDLVERVGRDHPRKLGIEDRLYGTMVIGLEQGVRPRNLGVGAAAGVLSMIRRGLDLGRDFVHLPKSARQLFRDTLSRLLREIWGDHPAVQEHGQRLIDFTWQGVEELRSLGIV
jgi:mannitol-1-phosphate/altronate dehydrogenase